MTLKEFAQEQGVSESTVRSWKRRGKIGQLTEGGPWHFFEDSQRVATPQCNAFATRNAATRADSVAVAFNPETISRSDCDPRARHHIALEERVDRDVYALTREIELLKELVGDLARRVVALEAEAVKRRLAAASDSMGIAQGRLNEIDPPGPNWGA